MHAGSVSRFKHNLRRSHDLNARKLRSRSERFGACDDNSKLEDLPSSLATFCLGHRVKRRERPRATAFIPKDFLTYLSCFSWSKFLNLAPLAPLRAIGLSESYLASVPTSVKIYLSWGNKFIAPKPSKSIKTDLIAQASEVCRKVSLRYAMRNCDVEPRVFPIPVVRCKSSYRPNVPVSLSRVCDKFMSKICSTVEPLKCYTQKCPIASAACEWMSKEYRAGRLLRLTGDKGYGPAIACPSVVSSQYAKLKASGSFVRVSREFFVEHMHFLNWKVRKLVDCARLQSVISDSTATFILSKFDVANFNYVSIDQLDEFVLSYVARLRFLVKFHKSPVSYRQVENDSRSMLTPLATVVGKFLNSIQTKIVTCAKDSRAVICKYMELTENFVHHKPVSRTLLWSADIVDFFNKIDLPTLMEAINFAISLYVQNVMVAKFISSTVEVLLHSKFVILDGEVWHKKQSLSIGEHIATAAASIFRWYVLDRPVLEWFSQQNIVSHFYTGYVDDLHGLIELPESQFVNVMDFMNRLHPSIALEGGASHTSVDFLDLTVYTECGEVFQTKLYKKPSFCPQYVPSWSFHRPVCVHGVFKGEANRYLMCCSESSVFDKELSTLIVNLKKR